MARVTLELPALLRDLVGTDELALDAATPADALTAAAAALPALRTHLFDASGAVRRHVLCFRNERAVRGEALDEPLDPGDRLRVHQAVSGG
jgi:molybdopterin converting factor small subunit